MQRGWPAKSIAWSLRWATSAADAALCSGVPTPYVAMAAVERLAQTVGPVTETQQLPSGYPDEPLPPRGAAAASQAHLARVAEYPPLPCDFFVRFGGSPRRTLWDGGGGLD
jgi:hypothetical protein